LHVKTILPVLLAGLVLAPTARADLSFLKKGYIQNDRGEKCWYTQITKSDDRYFHDKLTSNTYTITFDNPKCMADSGVGLIVNKMMINNIITRWYSHSDSDFQTKADELYKGSLYQVKGQCIQSRTYPIIGVTVDYIVKESSIVKVIHGQSAGPCSND